MSAEGRIELTILTPERRLVEKVTTQEVTLTGTEGTIQVLPGHAAFIGVLDTGRFSYASKEGLQEGVISSGFFEVTPDAGDASVTHLSLMAETLELREEIDLDRARKAQAKAESAIQGADLDDHAFKKYQLKIQRAMVRQNLGGSA